MLTRVKAAVAVGCTAIGLTGLTIASAPAASATSSGNNCVGSLVEGDALRTSTGTVLGYLNIYWDASTGQNCATVTSSSLDWGISKPMGVAIVECQTDTPNTACNAIGPGIVKDPPAGPGNPNYSYNAGPVSVPAVGHCIRAGGEVIFNGQTALYNTPTSHC